jgi:hypothetical protein
MIVSAMISKLRRKVGDIPQSTQALRAGDGSSTLFSLPKRPIMEGSYSVYFGTSAKSETTHYALDKDTGDLEAVTAPGNGINVKAVYKYANFRDTGWVEAINYGIDYLNARGFFRQVVRDTSSIRLSAGIQTYTGPATSGGCVDLYQVLLSDNQTVSGNFVPLPSNWDYQQDANKLIIGYKPTTTERLAVSWLRKLRTYSATSATIDVPSNAEEVVALKAEEYYWDHMAGKIATEGSATIDEGHFSFSNLRTKARDAERSAEFLANKNKPTRPAKEVRWAIPGQKV